MSSHPQHWRFVLERMNADADAARAAEEAAALEAEAHAPSPCDGCWRASRCAEELLACSAFERFTAGRQWESLPRVDATRERYARIFGT